MDARERAQRLVFTASAPFSYALRLAGGLNGFDWLNGRVFRLLGGENTTGMHVGGFGGWLYAWLCSWIYGWLYIWLYKLQGLGRQKKPYFLHKGRVDWRFLHKKGLQFLCADWLCYRLIVSGLQ